MSQFARLDMPLPPEADPAVRVADRLREDGHVALLAGGCVRDLLMGAAPSDYDVATDATPDKVCRLFRATRKVGAQFGVVLVRKRGEWIEVATFRADGRYSDGRHPDQVTFSDARGDAQRRDFTINGMFLDPSDNSIIDYVGGRDDLDAGVLRAIGDPIARFGEDHLRLLRAVRFAARLDFEIEPTTLAAVKSAATMLVRVSGERIREELEKMLGRRGRCIAVRLMAETGLLHHLWPNASWSRGQIEAAQSLLACIPDDAPFELAFAILLADRDGMSVHDICRDLTFSNEQRETTAWLVGHHRDLDDSDAIALASLKRLMAHPAFAALRMFAEARFAGMSDGGRRTERLERRIGSIRLDTVQPAPFVTGDDLIAAGAVAGPVFSDVLDEIYTRQLDETIASRERALELMQRLLDERT